MSRRNLQPIGIKLEAIEKLENGASLRSVAKEYGVGRSTVCDWNKNKEFLKEFGSTMDREVLFMRYNSTSTTPALDEALSTWVNTMRNTGEKVDDTRLKERAIEIYEEKEGTADLAAAMDWLGRWKRNHRIYLNKVPTLIDKDLSHWIRNLKAKGMWVTREMVKEKAIELNEEHNGPADFVATDEWANNWMKNCKVKIKYSADEFLRMFHNRVSGNDIEMASSDTTKPSLLNAGSSNTSQQSFNIETDSDVPKLSIKTECGDDPMFSVETDILRNSAADNLRSRSPSHSAKNITPINRIQEFGQEILMLKDNRLACRACSMCLDHSRRSTIVEHLRSKRHLRFCEISNAIESPDSQSPYILGLADDEELITAVSPDNTVTVRVPTPPPPTPALSGPYLLKKDTHTHTILDQLMRDVNYADVTISSEGKSIQAHKMVLCLASGYFKRELKTNVGHNLVVFNDVKFTELKNLIGFMYTGEATVDASELESFMKTAEMLEISSLCDGNPLNQKKPENATVKINSTTGKQAFGKSSKSSTKRPHSNSTSGASPMFKVRRSIVPYCPIAPSPTEVVTSEPEIVIKQEPFDEPLHDTEINTEPETSLLRTGETDIESRIVGGGSDTAKTGGSTDKGSENGLRDFQTHQKASSEPDDDLENDNGDIESDNSEISGVGEPTIEIRTSSEGELNNVDYDEILPGKCPFCSTPPIESGSSLLKHLQSHSERISYLCEKCNRVYDNQRSLQNHSKICLSNR